MKKIISLFVICILCLALCSCHADKENPNLQSTKNHIHSFDQWVIVKNATCTEDGCRFFTSAHRPADFLAKIAHPRGVRK